MKHYKHHVSIYCPQMAYRDMPYATFYDSSLLEIIVDGEKLKRHEHEQLFDEIMDLIRSGNANGNSIHAVIESRIPAKQETAVA